MLLQKAIGFGKVLVYYEDTDPQTCNFAKYGQCYREDTTGSQRTLISVRHANEQYKEENEIITDKRSASWQELP